MKSVKVSVVFLKVSIVYLLLCNAVFSGPINEDINLNEEKQSNNSGLQADLNSVSILNRSNVGMKKCHIWFEVNNRELLGQYIKSSKQWQSFAVPMVTARSHNVEVFTEELINNNIPIITGFKTAEYFRDKSYDDIDAWREIAKLSRRLSELTNGRAVILENEGAVKYLLDKGITEIDYKKLVESISAQQWPNVWFWYAPDGRRELVQLMTNVIAKAVVNGIPNVRLIEASSSGFNYSPSDSISNENLMRTINLDENPVSIIYPDDVKTKFWNYKHIDFAISKAYGNDVIIYPRFSNIDKRIVTRNCYK